MAAITDLSSLVAASLATGDLLPIHDLDAATDKKIAISDLLGWTSTFTPTLKFGGSSTGITYFDRGLTYKYNQHLGTVFMRGFVSISNKGSATGNATIDLPVAPNSAIYIIPIVWTGLNNNWVSIQGYITSGEMYLAGLQSADVGAALLTDTAFDNSSNIYWTGFYFT